MKDDVMLVLKLPQELKQELAAVAEDRGFSISKLVRQFIKSGLQRRITEEEIAEESRTSMESFSLTLDDSIDKIKAYLAAQKIHVRQAYENGLKDGIRRELAKREIGE